MACLLLVPATQSTGGGSATPSESAAAQPAASAATAQPTATQPAASATHCKPESAAATTTADPPRGLCATARAYDDNCQRGIQCERHH